MRYYTPELYVRLNSRDNATAVQADNDWNRVEAEYESCLKMIRSDMPESVRFVADKLCLHDAQFLNLVQSPQSVQVWTQDHDTLYVLDYHPTGPAEIRAPYPSEVFYPQFPRWLYDEIELPRPGSYSHEILLSDGRVVRIQFDRVQFFELHPSGTAEKLHAAENMLRMAKRISNTKAAKNGLVSVTFPSEELQTIKRAVRTIKSAGSSRVRSVASDRKTTALKPQTVKIRKARREPANQELPVNRRERRSNKPSPARKS